jgi:hypothetical protein
MYLGNLAPLWPSLGILIEALILAVVIKMM